MKKFSIVFLLLLLVAVVVEPLSVFAESDDDNNKPTVVGTPEIVMINGPVFDVSAGKETVVEIQLKNTSSFSARSIVVLPTITDLSDNPFHISFEENTNKISSIAPLAERTVKMKIKVDKTAATKTYGLSLKYTYFNSQSDKSSSSDTFYLKVKNTESMPNFKFDRIAVEPSNIIPGETGQITGELRNEGPIHMYDINIALNGLSADAVSVNGVNNLQFKKLEAGNKEGFAFTITTNEAMAAGNYPVTLKVTYKDENGKEGSLEQSLYLSVGTGTAGKKPALEIQNMLEPKGTYTVNQNFTITFDLVNLGEESAKNVKITAVGMGSDGAVVPKSTSVQTINELEVGGKRSLSFVFAGTNASKSENYPIEFTVEYEEGKTKEGESKMVSFKQYAGANITNPKADEKEEEDSKAVNKPKIIVSDYQADPIIVMAGSEFDLTMTFLNTHAQKRVKNIKMFLTLAEETSTNDTKTGNIFTPVNSSNTFYFDSIGAKSTANKKMRLYVVPDAQPKTYTLTVNFEYEDEEGHEFTATELLGINVKQPTKLEVGDIYIPPMVEAGMPINVSFELYNTGKVTLSNLLIKIDGDVETQNKSTYFGNFESGNSEYYDGTFTPMNEGEVPVNILVSYDDPSGERFEESHEYMISVTAPAPMPEGMEGDMMGMGGDMQDNSLDWKKIGMWIGAAVGGIIVICILLVIHKKRKAKAEAAFLAADDDEGAEDVNSLLSGRRNKRGQDNDAHR